VEAGELPLQAAIREVEEETALTRLEFPWGEVYRETTPYSDGKVARYYVAFSPDGARVSLPINPELGRPEHHEFRWVSNAEAKLLLPDRLQAVLDWVHDLVGAPAASQVLETKR
jgi:bis(5'-nucleosidyl)-tetraphosphatase